MQIEKKITHLLEIFLFFMHFFRQIVKRVIAFQDFDRNNIE